MRRIVVHGVIAVQLVLVLLGAVQGSQSAVRIGLIFDGPWERNDEILELKRSEIESLLEDEFTISFPESATLMCDFSKEMISAALDSLLASDAVDIVIASGPIASHLAVARRHLTKPVLAPYVIDQSFHDVPFTNGASGIPNLNYLAPPWHVEAEIGYFRDIMPFDKLGFLATGHMIDAFPGMCAALQQSLRKQGIEIQVVEVRDDVDAALEHIESNVEAVYVTSLLHLSPDQLASLALGLQERELPSFSMMGKYHVERGMMIGLMPEDFFIRVGRRLALNIQRILLGEEAGALPVAFPKGEQLAVNMAVVRAIDKYPSWAVLTEAEMINQTRKETARVITLRQTMADAVSVNLDLVADAVSVEASRETVKQAWMSLLPQVEGSLLGTIIDDDLAAASFGSQPERSLTGSISATQLIFSDAAWGNISISKNLQLSREARFRRLKLDIGQAAAAAFLNVLRAKTLERIQRNNLKVTRQNLNLARVRQSLGAARAAEVLRWESLIATNQRDVINANSVRNIAEMQLNRILHRPAEESFTPEEATIQNPDLISSGGRLFEYMSNPRTFRLLRSFMVEEAYRNSPELKEIDAAIAVQTRLVDTHTRSFFAPTIGLGAEISRRLDEGGAGVGGSNSFSGMGLSFPTTDRTNWQVGIEASLPLFKGGSRFSERSQSLKVGSSLRLQREAVAARTAQRVRSATHAAGASYAGIRLARASAEAAEESLELVTDAYSLGAVSILDVIDAQSAALVAGLSAANAVYDFLIDLIEVERASGQFVALMNDEERQAVVDRLDAFFASQSEQD